MSRAPLDRLRRLALEGDPVALPEWLAELARRDSLLEADLTPTQGRKLAGDAVEAGVELSTLRTALDLAQSHSIAFASIAAQLRDALAAGAGRRWFRFPKGAVWHSVTDGEHRTACGCSLPATTSKGRVPRLARLLPGDACTRCRERLAVDIARVDWECTR